MRRAILVLVIIAAAGLVAYTLTRQTSERSLQPVTEVFFNGEPIFYLFHDPSDQDAGRRRIYAYADQAERELAGKVEVRRPDVKLQRNLVDAYKVRVLPTILLVSPNGQVERFEGEDKPTAGRIERALTRLKETAQ